MTKKQEKAQEKQEAIALLRKMGVRPGKRVYTSVSHVARSGMSRRIHVYIVTRNTSNETTEHGITEITGMVGRACGYRRHDRDGGLIVGGCGMDMGFALVYNIGRVMFPKGGPLSKSSPTRASQAELGAARQGQPKPTQETDGGYLLKHEWL